MKEARAFYEPNHGNRVFDLWGIEFMGDFIFPYGMNYILVAFDYVPKLVEEILL